MRYGIIADIHGNWEALSAVLAECRRLRVETLLCLGDILGYGASPRKCLEVIRKNKIPTVAGNHDWAVSGRLDASYFTDDGKAAVAWTRTQMEMDDISRLNGLPLILKNKDMILTHGSVVDPQAFIYLEDIQKAEEVFAVMDRPLCFTGHTHVPKIYMEQAANVYEAPATEIEVEEGSKYIVNPGSVGQPRDGIPLASFCLYDAAINMVEIHRVDYDIAGAQKKIIEAGLPAALADRLSIGR